MVEPHEWYLEFMQYYPKRVIDTAVAELRNQQSKVRGIMGAIIGGSVGIVAWKLSTCLGGLIFELSPLVIGGLVGYGIRRFGKGDSGSFQMIGLLGYLIAVGLCFGLIGFDCGFILSGFDLDSFKGLKEVGRLSPVGGAIIVWLISRRRINGDLVLKYLKSKPLND